MHRMAVRLFRVGDDGKEVEVRVEELVYVQSLQMGQHMIGICD